jgi:hypothetical protein
MQCSAKSNRSGKQCGRAAIIGGTVCWVHGGAAPQVRKAALRRIHSLVDPALETLALAMAHSIEGMEDGNAPTPEGIRAARDVLSRAGYDPAQHHVVDDGDGQDSGDDLDEILSELDSIAAAERTNSMAQPPEPGSAETPQA